MTLLGQTDCFSPWHTLWRNRNFKLWINKVLCYGAAVSEGPICGWHWVRAQWNRIRGRAAKKFHPGHLYEWGRQPSKMTPSTPHLLPSPPFVCAEWTYWLSNQELMAKVMGSFPRLGHKRLTSVLLMRCSLSLAPPSPYHYVCFDEASYHVGEVYMAIRLQPISIVELRLSV